MVTFFLLTSPAKLPGMPPKRGGILDPENGKGGKQKKKKKK